MFDELSVVQWAVFSAATSAFADRRQPPVPVPVAPAVLRESVFANALLVVIAA